LILAIKYSSDVLTTQYTAHLITWLICGEY
jgi:hypothetical protein